MVSCSCLACKGGSSRCWRPSWATSARWRLDPAQPGGWGSRTPNHFELTELGRRSLLTKLADTEDENAEVWEGLPGFQWYAPVLRAKAGSDVLAVHKDITNESGRIPLLATRTFGAGKVLFMGTDGAWRWRKGVEDKYHYRFWGQVVRLDGVSAEHGQRGNHAAVLRARPAENEQGFDLSCECDGSERRAASRRGCLRTDHGPFGQGGGGPVHRRRRRVGRIHRSVHRHRGEAPYKVALICKQTGATLDTTFFVQGAMAERVGRPSRPEVLEELARVTRGKVVEPDNLDDVVRTLAALPDPPPSVRRLQLWSHGGVAVVLIGLMGASGWEGRPSAWFKTVL